MSFQPKSSEEVAELVRESSRILARGGDTKPTLTDVADVKILELCGLAGITEYDSSEYVFTAKVGTPVLEIQKALCKEGQYLPFDPPFAEEGSTLGGMVAAGVNGPGRLRFGGIRDFLIGVTFVDGRGSVVRSGGKVVKNAAGFDLPKFLVGSLGRFGVLTEMSFKVFPKPQKYVSLRFKHNKLEDGLESIIKANASSWELDAIELQSSGEMIVRLGGTKNALKKRADRILQEFENKGEVLTDEDATRFWREANAFGWSPPGAILAKVPLTPSRILGLEEALSDFQVECRYSVAGNVAWLSWPSENTDKELDSVLKKLGLGGLVFRGNGERISIGRWTSETITKSVKSAFDPDGKFPSIP